jgi:hypothetical protein
MGWVRFVLLSFLIGASFAAVIESGDAGRQFVDSTSAAKCQEADVQAVYKCLGNIVRVVSSVPGEGSTFYKPDGRVITCPVVPPSEMGAECLQLMTPNYCPVQAECGFSPAPEVFPGQNDTPEQTGDADYYVVEGQAASDALAPPVTAPEPAPEPRKKTTIVSNNSFEAPVPKSDVDSSLGFLPLIVLLLGVGAVGVLFMLFRNSLAEEDS